MIGKPRHKEPTNFEHCCSCCGAQEKRIKHLEYTLKGYKKRVKESDEFIAICIEASDTRGGIM